MKYRIVKRTTYILRQEIFDVDVEDVYFIQYKIKLFGLFPYWKYLSRPITNYGNRMYNAVYFHTFESAKKFVDSLLDKGINLEKEITYETVFESGF